MRDRNIIHRLRLILGKRDVREALALVRLKEAKAVEQRRQRAGAGQAQKPESDTAAHERPKRASCNR